ncbi:hypothetical protein [Tengunoibacter tsumagoiensis]|uniref:Uncharacterized protein n=1 Tax=Tengunoibacter tsumagoiensis TaxID=2014871 RepID=A0A402A8U0_9CHLR|nr:hypothetical protein [Tengunoibacter tsumagoiensis]GCE15518.1 hypothetical protein KTT_53770 [Tengunoibacter tsumagoiensis]
MLDPLYEENLTPQRLERIRMMTSPPSLIESAVLKACGSPLQTLTRITDGFSKP